MTVLSLSRARTAFKSGVCDFIAAKITVWFLARDTKNSELTRKVRVDSQDSKAKQERKRAESWCSMEWGGWA